MEKYTFTLRDLWIAKQMKGSEVATAAGCSTATLYKMLRRGEEESGVAIGTVRQVCAVLGISLADYELIVPCPDADRYRQRPQRKKRSRPSDAGV